MTSFSQREPLTTRIRGLLEEYPVGTGILKEALQNSDDSGARTQVFLLDRTSYPLSDLFDPELKRYQGPALLLQNDSQFKKSDFESLSRLGESGKKEDIAKTGKFGLGFNSTYNLTDAPMILTGDQLVILEPHEEISQPRFKGGFRETFNDKKIPQNQLKPFEHSVPNGFEESFDGTIIRLPLRTKEDAARSKISNKEVSPEGIMEILEAFKSEAVESLLFLKNIEKIEVYELSSSTRKRLYSVEILDTPTIRDARSELVKALLSCTEQSKAEKSCTIDMKVLMTDYNSKVCQTHWLIRHEVNSNMMNTNEKFLREQKLLPWIGLAASLNFDKSSSGRLFTFLPLPITTSFPVHIHGIFGLTRDRRNFVQQCADHPKDSKPDIIGKWNKELFQTLIPAAWARLLVDLTKRQSINDQLPYWPSSTIEMQNNMYKDLLANILRRVQEDRLAVFLKHHLSSESTSVPQWLSLDDALVCTPNDLVAQILVDAGMQITCINDDIMQILVNKNIPFSKPSPSIVRQHLRSTSLSWPSILDRPAKESLLEYLCSDKNFSDLVGLELIPLANQKFATFTTSQQEQQLIYLINSENELNLFNDWSDRLVASKQKIFIENINLFKEHTNVQPWSFDASIQFLHEKFFKSYSSSEDEISGDIVSIEYLNKLWSWIDTQIDQSNSKLNSFWLIPTAHGKLRKVSAYPTIISRVPLISHERYGVIAGLLEAVNVSFLHEGFTENPSGYLKSFGLIKDLNDISNILDWLERQSWQTLNENQANAIREHFHHCFIARPTQLSDKAKETLRKLPIFKVLVAPKCENQDTLVELSGLITNSPNKVIAISSKQVIPILDGIILTYIPDSSSKYIVHNLLGIEEREFTDFLVNIVAPSLHQQPEYLLDALMGMILSNLNSISSVKNFLCDFPFVPCSSMPRASSSVYRRAPSELVDPNYLGLTKLFLPQENIFPVKYYADNFLTQLQLLGMSTRLNPSLIKSRVDFFVKIWNDKSTSNELKEHVHKRSLMLLKEMDGLEDFSTLEDLQRDIAWLPATTLSGELMLVQSSECRDQHDKDLVWYALPVVQYKLQDHKLIEFLGWNNNISVDILQKQIIGILDEQYLSENTVLEDILLPIFDLLEKYVSHSEQLDPLQNSLNDRWWIPVKDKFRRTSEVVFQEPDFSFEPYIVPLSYKLKKRAPQFLKYMGVQDSVNVEHMIEVLKKISIGLGETSTIVNKEELTLVVHIIKALSKEDTLDDDLRERILILDSTNRLIKINNITYCDLQPTKVNDTFDEISNYGSMANDMISVSVAKRLKIPLLSERILNDIIDNDYIEEHEQTESICTRISNTLLEYTIDSTSNEFIAIADDSGATTFKWIYDPYGKYSTKSLFCDEMDAWQGPSIFCYNNGLLTEDDIRALAKIGICNKQEDSTRYGLGFLSAYHWTDVPSIVSGNSAIFFDPQKKFLPYKRNSTDAKLERLGGLHIKNISKSKASLFNDQFAPFTGLCNFNSKEYFDGTLFRFPLRNDVIKSNIAVNCKCLDEDEIYKHLAVFFNSAIKSLFFLRNIKEIEAFVLTKDRALRPLWSVSLDEPSSDILDIRKFMTKKSSNMTLDICIKEFNKHDYLGGRVISNRIERWAVFSELVQMEELSLKDFAEINRVIPHIGIAAPLWTKRGNIIESPILPLKSCISSPLPTSICLNLPVHLCGYFALSSDCRSILLDGPNEKKFLWNDFLLRCIAKLYLHALTRLTEHPDRRDIYYGYWLGSKSEDATCGPIQPLYDEFWRLIWEENKNEKYNIFEACVLNESTTSKWISLREAIFSNPAEPESPIYIKVLLEHGNNNIVSLPLNLWQILRQSSNKDRMKLVDPALLRETIKGSFNIKKLLDSKELLHSQYTSLLKYLVSEDNLEDLIGCQILLLEDDSMAILMEQTTSENNFYVATAQELQLFDFLKSQFVSRNIPKEVIGLLTTPSAGLNVSTITPSVIRFLLRKLIPNSRLSKYPVGRKEVDIEWLKRFWEYWDSNAISLDELEDIPILPIGNPPTHLVSVNYLKDACLQGPKDDDLRRVIEKIGRIHLVYQNELPTKSVQIQVFNLENYLDCLAKTSPPTKVCACLTLEEKSILRNFVMKAVEYICFEEMGQRSKDLLAGFPVWRIWPENNPNLSQAKGTCLLPHPNIFFKALQQTTFLREESKYFPILESLGSRRLPMEEHFKEYIVPHLPHHFPPDAIDAYYKFLQKLLTLHDISTAVLANTRMVPDANGTLHYANELLDSTVALFHNVFTLDGKDKLLHPKFRDLKSKMHQFGLHHKLDGENFIKCAKEIERIWMSNFLGERPSQAIELFKYFNNTETTYTDEEWEQLSTILFIPTLLSPTKPFFGSSLSGTDRSTYPQLSCLKDLITQENNNIAWTQRPIFAIAPSQYLLRRCKIIWTPDVICVFKHLCCLAEIRKEYTSDAASFYNDLKATYAFLEKKSHEQLEQFEQLERLFENTDGALFLNCNNENDDIFDENFWCCASNIIINADYDISPSLRQVYSSLKPYPKLLEAAKAKQIKYQDDYPIPPPPPAAIPRLNFYRFYQEQIMIDAKFLVISSEGESEIIGGHRLLLAVFSSYFEKLLTGPMIEGTCSSYLIKIEALTPRAVRHAFEFIYLGELNEALLDNIPPSLNDTKNQISADNSGSRLYAYMLELLEVADRFLLDLMRDLVQNAIIRRKLLRIDTVRDLRERAKNFNAENLSKWCDEFEEMNSELVARANQE